MLPTCRFEPEMIAVVVKIIHCILGLRLIEPEDPDTLVVIVSLNDFPYMLPRLRVSGIEEHRVPEERPSSCATPRSLVTSNPLRVHLSEVGAALRSTVGQTDTMSLISNGFEFLDHSEQGRASNGIELAYSPCMGQWKKSTTMTSRGKPRLLVLARHRKKLLLCLVTQLALPETQSRIQASWEPSRSPPRSFDRISAGVVTCGDPVVDLLCGYGRPFSAYSSQT